MQVQRARDPPDRPRRGSSATSTAIAWTVASRSGSLPTPTA